MAAIWEHDQGMIWELDKDKCRQRGGVAVGDAEAWLRRP